MEREWAKKLNASQLESLSKMSEMEEFAKAKCQEAEGLQAKTLELEQASQQVENLQQAYQQERQATAMAVQDVRHLKRLHQASKGLL